ncbi:Uncharacterised protein [Mycobacteroides abscessus subsp. abscessus]|nr:Uncharacterised protein [Mycobacteroides abscessus subsp. abscessus]
MCGKRHGLGSSGLETSLQLIGEQQVRELGLGIGPHPAVTPLPLQIIEMYCCPEFMAVAADGDNA